MTENPAVIKKIEGTAVPVAGNDIDTDRIIPARFLRNVTFEGLGSEVFRDERYNPDGSLKPHPFNEERYRNASVLLVNENFGCGSSREHAPQAIMRFGIKSIIGESFAEIFAGNCTSLGIPVFTGESAVVRELQEIAARASETVLTLSVEQETVAAGGSIWQLRMTPASKAAFLEGTWDTLDELMRNAQIIEKVYARVPYTRA